MQTTGKLNVLFTVAAKGNYVMKLVDVIGKEVINIVYAAEEGKNLYEVDLNGFTKGVYNLTVGTEGSEIQSMRIVVD